MFVARAPYRIGTHQVIRLLDEVLDGKASHKDWLVFTGVPIRYDPELDAIRQRCLALEEAHLLGDASRHLFDPEGLAQLKAIRAELLALQSRL